VTEVGIAFGVVVGLEVVGEVEVEVGVEGRPLMSLLMAGSRPCAGSLTASRTWRAAMVPAAERSP
jgi:hypothetical protein